MTVQIQDPGAYLNNVQPENYCQGFNMIQHVLGFPCKTPSLNNKVFKQGFCSPACGHKEKVPGDCSKLLIQLIWRRTFILFFTACLMQFAF